MKKISVLALCLVLTASVLAGCGCRNYAAPTTVPTTFPTTLPTTAPTTAPTTVPTTQPTTEATTEPTIDYGNGPLTEPTDATSATDSTTSRAVRPRMK